MRAGITSFCPAMTRLNSHQSAVDKELCRGYPHPVRLQILSALPPALVGGARMPVATDVVIRLPPVLVVVYVLAIVIWYELVRLAVMKLVARRRSGRTERDEFEEWRRQEAELAHGRREAAEQEAAEESEPDPARRYYYIARRTARAERDAAVE